LEERVLLSGNPTYYTVNLTSDSGASSGTDATTGTPSGDLLWAVTQANANSNLAGSVIEFDPTVFATSQIITLTSTLVLSGSAGPEVIQGPGANLLTIGGNSAVEVLQVDSNVVASLSGLTLTAGSATNGGGINNAGSLAVTDTAIENSFASNDGGGIENSGTLTITDSTVANNTASNNGFGIENAGTLTLTNSTIAGNNPGLGSGNNGGGVDNAGAMTTFDTTIAYNIGGLGAGLYDEPGATATLDNTIIALNSTLGANDSNPTYDELTEYDIAGGPISSASA